eukprot:CAMPEP_0201283154 /NCGR_PEP_ID=MMETSP1317-20130820/7787_1 /ASSEMBLY_ACC=CAM_ASM_000770 /TAXON_ID=187299 /ORGANISM="Undescribed Undescribed, Strain Undescribed" /LENGTH=53 /DNA_ID=CAMNT_0047598435 /DNA_START=222 /DNA_END=383 /DNA_ORIENTATION=-
MGEVPGSGHAVKAINNLLYGYLIHTYRGIQALQQRGVDPHKAMDAINKSSGGS